MVADTVNGVKMKHHRQRVNDVLLHYVTAGVGADTEMSQF